MDLRRLAELRHRSSCCRSLQRRRELVESFQALCGSSASSRYSRRNRPGRMLAARTSRSWFEASVAGGLCRVLRAQQRAGGLQLLPRPHGWYEERCRASWRRSNRACRRPRCASRTSCRRAPFDALTGPFSSHSHGRWCGVRAARDGWVIGRAGRRKPGLNRARDARDRPDRARRVRAWGTGRPPVPLLGCRTRHCGDGCLHATSAGTHDT